MQKHSSDTENLKRDDSAVPPQSLTVTENLILTIKVLVVAGLIIGALWAFDRLMEQPGCNGY